MTDFDKFIAHVRDAVRGRDPIGLPDKTGLPIKEGDIIEFYFCADKGVSMVPDEGYTHMVDVVKIHNGQPFFWNLDTNGGAFAWRFNDACRVLGNIDDNPEILRDGLTRQFA